MEKKRVLFVNEASFLSTGYSVYGAEVLKRLYATGKYELGEFGIYAAENDPRAQGIPWKFYGNQPCTQQELEHFNNTCAARPVAQFGEYRFETVCLEFKPDIVMDIRDVWMQEFEERSPFRKYYRWAIMPTVDSAPVPDQWIATYRNADVVYAYSEFGAKTIQAQAPHSINLQGVASPGADLADFKVDIDKASIRKQLGVPEDAIIVGTVMRNQERKLYPDLMKAFRMFLEQASPEIAKRTYLYAHTSYPDVGWDIPKYLKEYDLINKTFFTYCCDKCRSIFSSFYQDARTFCPVCFERTAIMPSVVSGVSRQALGMIMSTFDIYVQYAVCEGFGMPLVEAAACGCPIMAVNYSAMEDIIRHLNGIPINPVGMFRDARTTQERALPDNQDFVNKLIRFLKTPEEYKRAESKRIRKATEKHYCWDHTAKIWESCFDRMKIIPYEQGWGAPPNITQPNMNVPEGLTNAEFSDWIMVNIAGRPELMNSYLSLRIVRDLNWEASQSGNNGVLYNDASSSTAQNKFTPYSRQDAINEMVRACEQKNFWEQQRIAAIKQEK